MTTEDRPKLLRSTRVSDHPDVLAAASQFEEERRQLLASTRVTRAEDIYKVVFANGEEAYPAAPDSITAGPRARDKLTREGRPTGSVPIVYCDRYST